MATDKKLIGNENTKECKNCGAYFLRLEDACMCGLWGRLVEEDDVACAESDSYNTPKKLD